MLYFEMKFADPMKFLARSDESNFAGSIAAIKAQAMFALALDPTA